MRDLNLRRPNWFSVFIMVVILIFTILAFDFTPRAKIVPLVIALPALILAFAQLIGEMLPGTVEKRSSTRGRMDNGSGGKVSLSQLPEGNETTPVSTGQEKKKLLAAMSPAVMLILMGIFGFIVGGMIYIAAYYYINGESRVNMIVTPLLLGIIMYVLFGYYLKVNLWSGILF